MTTVTGMRTHHADPVRPPADLLLRKLQPHHREILVATYFRHRTTTEAARTLGLSPDAAKAHLYHAMRHLTELLATTNQR